MKLVIRNKEIEKGIYTKQVLIDDKDVTDSVCAVTVTASGVSLFKANISFSCDTDIEIDNLEEINRKADGQSLVCQYTEQETKQRLQPMKRLLQRLRRQGERSRYGRR